MGKKSKRAKAASSAGEGKTIQLPKDALARINLGQAFAEYDHIRTNPSLLVKTPAIESAVNPDRGRLFFIGRRGTGKTATAYAVERATGFSKTIHPELFSPLADVLHGLDFSDTHQRPFRSLIAAFRRALQAEFAIGWLESNPNESRDQLSRDVLSDIQAVEEDDFDLAALKFMQEYLAPLSRKQNNKWLKQIKKPKILAKELSGLSSEKYPTYTLLIDRVDESWDGSPEAIAFLVALMHACLEVSTEIGWARAMMFLRENVLEMVRSTDSEFGRIETCIVGMDWTEEKLVELIERRMNMPFTAKLPADGSTWKYFFDDGKKAREAIFEYCQAKPRDILTYCSFALDSAQNHSRQKIEYIDLNNARKRFSDSRLKDLGAEYQDNYPQIQLVLSRFYGLGHRYTLAGIDAFIKKLLVDETIKRACSNWIYEFTASELFARLLYDIGFFGFDTGKEILFRSVGPVSTVPPAITSSMDLVIHPSFVPALDLQDVTITSLSEKTTFGKPGLLTEIPESLNIDEYQDKLADLEMNLKTLATGQAAASQFEDIVGDVIRLCFHRWLHNVEAQVRDIDNRTIRDWIASNRSSDGFWHMVREQYSCKQVIWECKNFKDLDSTAFQQIDYYLNDKIGRFGIIAYRGEEIKPHYYQHVKRIAESKKALVILIHQRDLLVFIRQARNGKIKEDHIQDRFDMTLRKIS